MVFAAGAQSGISDITAKTLVFLVLSGIATGASWLCYSRALKYGDVNKVTPIDKSSPVLTMILAFVFLHEEITLVKFFCIILIGAGTYMMIEKRIRAKPETENRGGLFGQCFPWLLRRRSAEGKCLLHGMRKRRKNLHQMRSFSQKGR